MFTDKRAFLVKCKECDKLLHVELDKEESVEEYLDGNLVFECQCGGTCEPLRD